MRNFNSELKLLKKSVPQCLYYLKKKGTQNFGRAPKILYVGALLAPLQKV